MSVDSRITAGFSEIDSAAPDTQGMLFHYLDRVAAQPMIQRLRQQAMETMRLAPGQRVLDAGAGAGEVARDLAAIVGPQGEVEAMDYSAAAVELAGSRHDGSSVHYSVGDITALPFPGDSFDVVRSERVIQHVTDRDGAVAELVRVLRPGGRICLIDTDWQSLRVDGPPADLLAPILTSMSGVGPRMDDPCGRALRSHLIRAGVTDVTAEPVTIALFDPAEAAVIYPVFDRGFKAAGLIPPDVLDPWFDALDSATARGEFACILTMWIAAGTK
jgi:ubiquinone/menaquinone biosynthesis C-methylase UbiE